MAVSFVDHYIDQGGATEDASLDGSGTDRLIVASVSASDSALRTLTSMTVGGVSVADIVNTGIDGGSRAIHHCFGHILDADDPGAGTQTMDPTWSGSAGPTVYSLVELAGVDQTTPLGTAAVNTDVDVVDSGSVAVTLNGHSGKFALVFVASGSANNNDEFGGHTLPAAATLIGTWEYNTTRVSIGYISAVASASESLSFTVSIDGSSDATSVVVGAVPVYAVGEVPAGTSIPPIAIHHLKQLGS